MSIEIDKTEMEDNMKYETHEKFGKVSKLGFGAMRFPKKGDQIDQEQVNAMIKAAYDAGVNYFDTAYVYGGGASEIALGKALKQFPRDSFFLADKHPFYNLKTMEERDTFFNTSLERCGVDYFDFYLIHAVNGKNAKGIIDYDMVNWAVQKKKEGKIRYLGFSMHDTIDLLNELLALHDWDFVQIQYNYLDTEGEPGTKGYEELVKRNIPITIMEPLKGGVLVNIPENLTKPFRDIGMSNQEIAFRWIAEKKGILTVLSGMSSIEQTEDNLRIFSNLESLTDEQNAAIAQVKKNIIDAQKVGCTGCAYCMPCPMGINIPASFKAWNTKAMNDSTNWISGADIDAETIKKCVECGQCMNHCPQKINVPEKLKELLAYYGK